MTLLEILALIAGIIGLIGSFVPGIPGPPVSCGGLLLMYLNASKGGGDPISMRLLVIWIVITVAVVVIGYVIPAFFTKLTGGSKYAARGSLIGLFAGALIPPVGMFVGSLIGAFIAEFLFADKGVWKSFVSSIGAFAGFIATTGLNIICSGLMLYYIIAAL